MRHWTTITAYALTLGLVGAPVSIQAAHHEEGEAAATSESAEAATDMAEEGTTDEAAATSEGAEATTDTAAEGTTDEAAATSESAEAATDMPEGSH